MEILKLYETRNKKRFLKRGTQKTFLNLKLELKKNF